MDGSEDSGRKVFKCCVIPKILLCFYTVKYELTALQRLTGPYRSLSLVTSFIA